MRINLVCLSTCVMTVMTGACGVRARVPVSAEMGAHPLIPRPSTSLIPVMKVVKAEGWPGDE
ncbi:MAG: sorbosone dehydrogenase family protein, partial [Gemmatimonadaceae bacterium]